MYLQLKLFTIYNIFDSKDFGASKIPHKIQDFVRFRLLRNIHFKLNIAQQYKFAKLQCNNISPNFSAAFNNGHKKS